MNLEYKIRTLVLQFVYNIVWRDVHACIGVDHDIIVNRSVSELQDILVLKIEDYEF